ncbi:MAG: response regulator [Bdellovibrionales bacterium]
MEIIHHKDYKDLLEFLPSVKKTLKEWLFVDIRVTEAVHKDLTVDAAADAIKIIFRGCEGKLYIFNDHEILMIVHWPHPHPSSAIADNIGKAVPEGGVAVFVQEATVEGISKLEILITYRRMATNRTFTDIRTTRRENVIIVADDDMYLRALVKKGVGANYTVYEVGDGGEVINAYKKYVPDVLFLDIHLPNKEGTDILQQLLAIDPNAFIVMLSADSSRENVEITSQKGAKAFLTKPFSKDRLQDCLNKCPTIS